MRLPIGAGTFYPADHGELISGLEMFFGAETTHFPEARGLIVPHAGYLFSGPVAAKTYKAVSRSDKKNFVILGTDHYGKGIIATSTEDWSTPLGNAKVNLEMIKRITKEQAIMEAPGEMKSEHSIEVQIPFLQYLFSDFTFVPLQVPRLPLDEIKDLAKIIADKNTIYIASSDFTHFGSNYGFVPKESIYGPDEYVKTLDSKIIDLIVQGDTKKFVDFIEDNDMTVCGYVPIALLMEVMKILGAKTVEKIAYDTSFSVSHDVSAIVGYGGLLFR
ncbi:MAG: AmmeMemoRadiSam system protein B [Candidatus Aenigmarchaeota archaeon]|nr:AmmeMemoRadiSam system protein B [Candidatus Aenigmarchaeota archaeon]